MNRTPPPVDHPTWLYLKLYPGRPDLLDATLTEVVAPLVAQVAPLASRWFFLRYLDTTGAHVRLRFHLAGPAADALAERRAELTGRLEALADRPAPDRPAPTALPASAAPGAVPSAGRAQGRPEVRLDLYEPEYAKWGGPRYLEVAERTFQASSATALRLLDASDGTLEHRLALGGSVMTGLLDRLGLTGEQRAGFLRTHYAWWSGRRHAQPADGAARDTALRTLHDRLLPTVRERAERLLATGPESEMISRLCADMLLGIEDRGPQQKPLFLAFHHLHLSLNRLGIVPVEEALVSLSAGSYPETVRTIPVPSPVPARSEES
ncbi:thiopeptide-type bacteriocin biosynthesis protein [Streptomyces sp. NPDC046876]|uniref:thiopeptide-type bacteriocin biosynthesis protein n=1 Tax=Streptomyces sp. NPDC046876 TaxID=3155616 RepID=UPI0033DFB33A